MKNRITELFERKNKRVLSIFFTAGYPSLNSTGEIIKLLEAHGADMIEVGIPFSDPLADGPVIQKSSEEALKNGMTLKLLFEQLKNLRDVVKIPIVLMGYLNPVLQFGMENFVLKCKETGIDGVILPDLPPNVYCERYKNLFEKNQLSFIFLVTSKTTTDRIKVIDSISNGFIYLVASLGTTGKKAEFDSERYSNIKSLQIKTPIMIGFGISDNESFERANTFSNGVIIGSAFVKAIENGNLKENIPAFINGILNNKLSNTF
ncbi:MAG: tryptophan synthase subunit alpha [Bacteroidota bacterium]